MRRQIALGSVLVILAAGCANSPNTASKPTKVAPVGAGSVTLAHKLSAPTDALRLDGSVFLDASYAVSHGRGTVLKIGGKKMLAPYGATVVESNVISNDGHSVVSQGSGNIAYTGVMPAIEYNMASVFDDVNGLVSQGSGNVVSANDARVVSQGSGNWKLLAADPTSTDSMPQTGESSDVVTGEQLPAVGMVVQVVSLADGRRMTVGLDRDSKPVYGAYTNQEGKFSLYLPRTLIGNVRIIATPETSQDRRMNLVLLSGANTVAQIDEDTAQATNYIQRSILGRLEEIMVHTPNEVSNLAKLFGGSLDKQLAAAAETGKVKTLSPEARHELAKRVADMLLSPIDLAAATYTDENKGAEPISCLKTMTEIVTVTRENMRKRMDEVKISGKDPAAEFNALPGNPKIIKPSDFMAYLVETLFTNLVVDELQRGMQAHAIVLQAGLPTDDERMLALAGASNGLLTYIEKQLESMPAKVEEAKKLLRDANKGQ